MDCYFVNFVPSELKPPNTFKDAIAEFLWFSFHEKMAFFGGLGDTQNWEKLKLFREGFADVSWCNNCQVLWIRDFAANWFSWGKYRSVEHGSVLETWINRCRDPENKSPFLEGTRLLDFVECCLSKVPLLLKWLSEILSDRSLPQNSFSIGLMFSCSQQFQEGQFRFLYINKRSIQLSVPLTYSAKSLRTSIPSTPPHPKSNLKDEYCKENSKTQLKVSLFTYTIKPC